MKNSCLRGVLAQRAAVNSLQPTSCHSLLQPLPTLLHELARDSRVPGLCLQILAVVPYASTMRSFRKESRRLRCRGQCGPQVEPNVLNPFVHGVLGQVVFRRKMEK
jgi:hypothetical protein